MFIIRSSLLKPSAPYLKTYCNITSFAGVLAAAKAEVLNFNPQQHHLFHRRPFSNRNWELRMETSAHTAEFPWGQVQQLDYQHANSGKTVQACHAMIFARTSAKFVGQLPCRAWVLMQMRFDGKLGFPGGIISDLEIPDPTLEEGLNREMNEEIGLDLQRFSFNRSHYVVSHFCPKANLILNFFAREVSEADFRQIEAAAIRAEEYGNECMGVIRVPLYTLNDGQGGLPSFFRNQFAGTSLLQLAVGLVSQKIVTNEEIREYATDLPRHAAFTRLLHQAVNAYNHRNGLPVHQHSARVHQVISDFSRKVRDHQ